jgi:hypothetical protein
MRSEQQISDRKTTLKNARPIVRANQVTTFIAPLMVAFFTRFYGNQAGFGSVLILLIAGFILMFWVKETRESS